MSKNETQKKLTLINNADVINHHLSMIQDIISRLANNSSTCKNWCVSLVSAMLAISLSTDIDVIIFSFFPVFSFMLLDSYYLSTERSYRKLYDFYIMKIESEKYSAKDAYAMNIGKEKESILKSLKSPSIIAFYVPFLLLALLFLSRSK